MKELIENQLGIKLDNNSYSEKIAYGGFIYFFKRELQEDHYFKTKHNKVYVLKYNKDNFNPSLTETGRFPDSFKIKLEQCEEIKLYQQKHQIEENIVTMAYKEPSILDVINDLKSLLNQTSDKLNQLENKINN